MSSDHDDEIREMAERAVERAEHVEDLTSSVRELIGGVGALHFEVEDLAQRTATLDELMVERLRTRFRRRSMGLMLTFGVLVALQLGDLHLARCSLQAPSSAAEAIICDATFPAHRHPPADGVEPFIDGRVLGVVGYAALFVAGFVYIRYPYTQIQGRQRG